VHIAAAVIDIKKLGGGSKPYRIGVLEEFHAADGLIRVLSKIFTSAGFTVGHVQTVPSWR